MTTEDTHESTDGAAAQQQCPASGDTDSPREDVPTADEGGAPGDEDEGQLFVGKILKHPYRKYRCKENDSVVTVCRKLKISEVKEVFELNRRRLADVEHFRQSTKLRKGHVLLVPSSTEVLETTVTKYDGWWPPGAGEEEWRESWSGEDPDGQAYDLEAVDVYTGLGYEVHGGFIGRRVHVEGLDAKVVAYMPGAKEGENAGEAQWLVHFENADGPTGQRQDLDRAELEMRTHEGKRQELLARATTSLATEMEAHENAERDRTAQVAAAAEYKGALLMDLPGQPWRLIVAVMVKAYDPTSRCCCFTELDLRTNRLYDAMTVERDEAELVPVCWCSGVRPDGLAIDEQLRSAGRRAAPSRRSGGRCVRCLSLPAYCLGHEQP